MCIDILRNPAGAFAAAKKRKSTGRTVRALLESALIAGIVGIVLAWNAGPLLAAGLAITLFVVVLVFALVFAYIVRIAALTLGGKGSYHEGLTVVSYALVPITLGMLIAALLSLVPYAGILGALAMAALFALGLSALYRGIKDLFGVDYIASLLVVSIVTISLIVALYVYIGLNLLANLGSILPVA